MGKRPQVVVVGAGFAGLWTARTLQRCDCDVLVVDRNNYHTFFPLLYQVAAGELEPEQIAFPVRGIFRRRSNVDFAMAEVERIDLAARTIHTDVRPFAYDFLVLTMGSKTNFFDVPGAAEYAFRLKTLEQGIALRNRILSCFEKAAQSRDGAALEGLLTFTVVGGGPTGLEYAGALAELVRRPLARDYPAMDMSRVRIKLIEAQNNLLPGFPDRLRTYARQRLERMGVDVLCNTQVVRVSSDSLELEGKGGLATETVLWTAGVMGASVPVDLGLPVAPDGRLEVGETLQLANHPEVFVAGDLCRIKGDDPPLPMIAPVAIQQGRCAAMNILRIQRGEGPKSFRYRDKGTMATIGRNAAVVRLGKYSFTGFPAWVLWLFVHLLYLIGFRNRLVVLINWAWDYFLIERAIRLILPREPAWVQRTVSSSRDDPPPRVGKDVPR